jgi:hypothetical protein
VKRISLSGLVCASCFFFESSATFLSLAKKQKINEEEMYFTGMMESTSQKQIVGERKLTVCNKIENRKYDEKLIQWNKIHKKLQNNQKRREERRNEQDTESGSNA